jgi:hypothetical protein
LIVKSTQNARPLPVGRWKRRCGEGGALSAALSAVVGLRGFSIRFDRARAGLRVDRDLARLQAFRQHAHQLNRQHAIDQPRGVDADVIGEAELALKVALGDAAMQVAARFFNRRFAA